MNLNFEQARILMVKNQLRPNKIKEKVILDLFQSTPKENFVPEDFKTICYLDKNINILNKRGYLKNISNRAVTALIYLATLRNRSVTVE